MSDFSPFGALGASNQWMAAFPPWHRYAKPVPIAEYMPGLPLRTECERRLYTVGLPFANHHLIRAPYATTQD